MTDYVIYNGELYHFNPFHDKLGRFSSSSRAEARVSSLSRKIDKTKARIEKNNNKLAKVNSAYEKHAVRNARKEAAASKLETRRAAMQNKVSKINTKINIKGRRANFFERRTLRKAYSLDKRIARLKQSSLKHDAKVARINYKNEKLSKRLNKYMKKYDRAKSVAELNASHVENGRKAVEAMTSKKS